MSENPYPTRQYSPSWRARLRQQWYYLRGTFEQQQYDLFRWWRDWH